jgi:hypothetical protein
MNLYDVYFGYVEFADKNGGKNRPVIIAKFFNHFNTILFLPVYSYKKWFDSVKSNSFFEINDIADAGLDKRSYVNMDKMFSIDSKKLANYKKLVICRMLTLV